MNDVKNNEIVRLDEVIKMTCLARPTIYRLILENKFPKQIKITKRASAWVKAEVQDFIDARIAERGELNA